MITVTEALQDFLLARTVERCSPETLKWYRWHLEAFAALLSGVAVADVSATQIRSYMLANPRISAETLRARHRALRVFWNWCVREYHLPYNPMENIKPPRVPRPGPKAAAKSDILKMLAVCGDDLAGQRDRAIIMVLADTGIRAGGLLRLRPGDLDGRFLTVTEKGQITRRVPISEVTEAALTRWLEVRPVFAISLFCALSPAHLAQPLTVSGLNQLLKRRAHQAGVKGRWNPHSFRHAFGVEMLLAGADSAIVSKILGHSSIKVTVDTYMNVGSDTRIAAHHEQFSPLRDVGQK